MTSKQCNSHDYDVTQEWLSTEPLEKVDSLPDFGFRLRFDHKFTEHCRPFTMPRLNQIPDLIGMAFR